MHPLVWHLSGSGSPFMRMICVMMRCRCAVHASICLSRRKCQFVALLLLSLLGLDIFSMTVNNSFDPANIKNKSNLCHFKLCLWHCPIRLIYLKAINFKHSQNYPDHVDHFCKKIFFLIFILLSHAFLQFILQHKNDFNVNLYVQMTTIYQNLVQSCLYHHWYWMVMVGLLFLQHIIKHPYTCRQKQGWTNKWLNLFWIYIGTRFSY